jgi:pilus assembly protein CpaC
METNVELGPGQSFVIGGLLDDRVQDSLNRIPGLSSIPLLGAFFKSRDERKNKTELIVMVTPEITKPLEPGEARPMPPMPREFLGPVEPADKQSSKRIEETPIRDLKARKPEKKAAKGIFEKKK